MFGYVRINKNNLRISDWQMYRKYYCLLCKNMGSYSQLSRLFLSYDMVFLMIVSGAQIPEEYACAKRANCLSCSSGSDFQYWACLSILLIYYKLENDVADGGRYKKVFLKLLRKAKKKCSLTHPRQDQLLNEELGKIAQLEKENCCDIPYLSDIFANMMAQIVVASPSTTDSAYSGIAHNITYWLSRWIYIIDAYDDMKKDKKRDDFNPFLLYEHKHSVPERKAIARLLLEECLERIEHYCSLYPYTDQYSIMCNVLAEGVPKTTLTVLERNED